MLDVLQTEPSSWKYLSEGGATIVFSYKGPPHSDFDGTVLRLRKAPLVLDIRNKATAVPLHDQESDDPTIEFQTKCMQRLIPSEHLPRLESIRLNHAWLEELATLQNGVRPEARRQKDQIDLNKMKGVLATDLVGGDWLAVEIKPKWAFLPSPVHLSEETRATKLQTCRFCMHSYFRGHQAMSDYCPLDLYSGNENRVLKAIHYLWDGWIASDGAANNLKIFAAGKFVRPSEAKSLLADSHGNDRNLGEIGDAFTTALSWPLLRTPVLRIIAHLQRSLDVLDIEGLSKLWREAEKVAFKQGGADASLPFTPLGGKSPFIQVPDPNISEWDNFLNLYLSAEKDEKNHTQPSLKDLRYYILALLLSATFKDCSIIVKLKFLQPEVSQNDEIKPETVTVIDLDPKGLDKLKGWEELDWEIVNAYSPEQKKVCIDERR